MFVYHAASTLVYIQRCPRCRRTDRDLTVDACDSRVQFKVSGEDVSVQTNVVSNRSVSIGDNSLEVCFCPGNTCKSWTKQVHSKRWSQHWWNGIEGDDGDLETGEVSSASLFRRLCGDCCIVGASHLDRGYCTVCILKLWVPSPFTDFLCVKSHTTFEKSMFWIHWPGAPR